MVRLPYWDPQAEVEAARLQLHRDREFGQIALNALFRRGTVPLPPLDGRYRGELVALILPPLLSLAGRAALTLWMPWQGKLFDAARHEGKNLFGGRGAWLLRLFWPAYHGWRPDGRGLRGLRFYTSIAPGVLDPDLRVLRLDYNLEENPRLLVRSIFDELVQLAPGYYLGKACMRRSGGAPRCLAFFSLTPATGVRSASQ
jgi:hypothetical protein